MRDVLKRLLGKLIILMYVSAVKLVKLITVAKNEYRLLKDKKVA